MEETKETSGQPSLESSASEQEKKADVVAYETYTRTLGEAKKAKEKVKQHELETAELRARLESLEQEKLEAQGKTVELNDSLKKRVLELEGKLKEKDGRFANRVLGDQIRLAAQKAGAHNPDMGMKAGSERFESLLSSMDENYQFDSTELEQSIKEIQKEHSYLFKSDVPPVNQAPMKAQVTDKPPQKLSSDELRDKLIELEKATGGRTLRG